MSPEPNRQQWFFAEFLIREMGAAEAVVLGTGSVYAPDELIFFRRVMDEALETLPSFRRTPLAKAEIARRIMDCASTGQRDRSKLLLAALTDFNSAIRSIGA